MSNVNLTRLVEAISESISDRMSESCNDTVLCADSIIRQIMEDDYELYDKSYD